MVSHVSIKVIIRDFMGLRDVKVEISKTLLYGPNAAGKSRVIYALMNVINHHGLMEYFAREMGETVREELAGDYDVVVGDTTITVSTEKDSETVKATLFKVVSPRGEFGPSSYETVDTYIAEAFKKIGVRKAAWVTDRGDIVIVDVGGSYNPPMRVGDVKALLEKPEEVERVEELWKLFTSAWRFYYGKVRIRDGWISPSLLSAGERKAMTLIYLAKFTDLLIVEAFEGGLHIDMALDLISLLSDEAKYVVLETHYGLAIGKALQHNWNVYYLSEGKAFEVANLRDVARLELLEKEAKIYGSISLR